MNEGILYEPPSRDQHACQLPTQHLHFVPRPDAPYPRVPGVRRCTQPDCGETQHNIRPDADVGALWQCLMCGRWWIVQERQAPNWRMTRLEWCAATWWQRRRARRQQLEARLT